MNNLMWLNKIDLAYTGLLVETSSISTRGRFRRPSELMLLTSPSWHSKFVDIWSSFAAVSGSLKLKHSIALFGATFRIIGSSNLLSKVVSARSIRSTGTCMPATPHDFIQAPWSRSYSLAEYIIGCVSKTTRCQKEILVAEAKPAGHTMMLRCLKRRHRAACFGLSSRGNEWKICHRLQINLTHSFSISWNTQG